MSTASVCPPARPPMISLIKDTWNPSLPAPRYVQLAVHLQPAGKGGHGTWYPNTQRHLREFSWGREAEQGRPSFIRPSLGTRWVPGVLTRPPPTTCPLYILVPGPPSKEYSKCPLTLTLP